MKLEQGDTLLMIGDSITEAPAFLKSIGFTW
jgi:hypothetical protein